MSASSAERKSTLFLPLADRIEITEIAAEPEGDTVLEAFDREQWHEETREEHPAENGQPAFAFVTLLRK